MRNGAGRLAAVVRRAADEITRRLLGRRIAADLPE